MRFYAANNQYATDTDTGFYNTWYVLAFDSKKNRDNYVEKQEPNKAVCAIHRLRVSFFVNREPKPFTKERYALTVSAKDYEGLCGEVSVATPDNPGYIEDL